MIREDVFQIEKKRIIYNYIQKNPGIHLRKLSRNLKIPKTTLEYHLSTLEKIGLISTVIKNNYKRYYTTEKINGQDKQLLNILRETVPRNIILYLLLYGNCTIDELTKFAKNWDKHPSKIGYVLNKHRTTIEFHLNKLTDMKIISFYTVDNKRKYYLANPEEICSLCITYEKSLLGAACGRCLTYIDFDPAVDKIMEEIYKIFPNPYYCG